MISIISIVVLLFSYSSAFYTDLSRDLARSDPTDLARWMSQGWTVDELAKSIKLCEQDLSSGSGTAHFGGAYYVQWCHYLVDWNRNRQSQSGGGRSDYSAASSGGYANGMQSDAAASPSAGYSSYGFAGHHLWGDWTKGEFIRAVDYCRSSLNSGYVSSDTYYERWCKSLVNWADTNPDKWPQ